MSTIRKSAFIVTGHVIGLFAGVIYICGCTSDTFLLSTTNITNTTNDCAYSNRWLGLFKECVMSGQTVACYYRPSTGPVKDTQALFVIWALLWLVAWLCGILVPLARPKCHIYAYYWIIGLSVASFFLQSLTLIVFSAYSASSMFAQGVFCRFGAGYGASVSGLLICMIGYGIAIFAAVKECMERPKQTMDEWIAEHGWLGSSLCRFSRCTKKTTGSVSNEQSAVNQSASTTSNRNRSLDL